MIQESINQEEPEAIIGNSIIALFQSGGRLGISQYSEESNSICTDGVTIALEEIEDLMHNLKRMFEPTLFLVHPRIAANESLLSVITEQGPDDTHKYYSYKVIRSASWNVRSTVDLLSNRLVVQDILQEGSNTFGNKTGQEKYIALAGVIDMDNFESLSSMGALLTFLQENVMNLENGMMYISKLSSITLESYMRLTSGTQKALQIFQEDYHPNVIKGSGRSKEGFSVFTMLDRTTSSVGRACLKVWMARPLCDKEKILSRQDGIEVLMRIDNQEYVVKIAKILKQMHDMPKIILRIKKVAASYKEWCNLVSALGASLQIFEEISAFFNHVTKDIDKRFIYSLFDPHDVETLRNVYSALHAAIDIEASLTSGELMIIPGYSVELDNLSEIYNNLETFLTEAARSILDSAPLLAHVAVEYVPQIGYLAAIGLEDTHFLNPEEFKLVYEMGKTGYFKCNRLYEMDDSIGDIKATISDLKNKIMLILEEACLNAEGSFVEVSAGLGTLDATLSLANVAVSMNFVRPDISEESIVIIKNGRHPLAELTVDAFVPNDTYLTSEMNVALITGENGSGKSVYLKQVGILVYLAHTGSFIPCEKAIIGLTDKILTRISSMETSFSPHSAFSLDCCQTTKILLEQTPRSLCLVDEFGKGTAPVDGMALLAGCVQFFAERSTKCLFVLHFTEILMEEIIDLSRYPNIETFKMVVHQELSSDEDKDDLVTPLYKLQIGVSDSSGGISCAKLAGLSADICTRAHEIRQCLDARTVIPLRKSKKRLALGDISNVLLLKHFFFPVHRESGNENKWSIATGVHIYSLLAKNTCVAFVTSMCLQCIH